MLEFNALRNRLAIDVDGAWTYDGQPILHSGISRLLFDHLGRDENGRLIVRVGRMWSWVRVEDTPYVVVDVDLPGDTPDCSGAGISIKLQDGSVEILDPRTLTLGRGGALYARVKGGAEEARFLRNPHYRLGSLAVEHGDDRFAIRLGDEEHPLPLRPTRAKDTPRSPAARTD